MRKKNPLISLILALVAVAIPSVTFSLNYSGSQKNQAKPQ